MKVELREINQDNWEQCIALAVTEEQAQYIVANEISLKDASEDKDVARPFAIYADDRMAGFAMFAFDVDYEDPDDRYWLWRFMIDKDLQGQGYGSAALRVIIDYFREQGADHIKLSTKASNTRALTLYHKFGFQENGEMNDGEEVLVLKL